MIIALYNTINVQAGNIDLLNSIIDKDVKPVTVVTNTKSTNKTTHVIAAPVIDYNDIPKYVKSILFDKSVYAYVQAKGSRYSNPTYIGDVFGDFNTTKITLKYIDYTHINDKTIIKRKYL
jgi:hypothetical protein